MRREKTEYLINWKNNPNKKPLIIFGARQVGKTYMVEEFAKENYEYFYYINFEFEKDACELFSGNLDIKTILLQLSAYKINTPIKEGKTLIFLDEVQRCPDVLTALKSFSIDGRFDVICSGSMLGIIMNEISSYPVGYVETLTMKPMNFKEFLWASGYDDNFINILKEFYDNMLPLPEALHNKLNKLFTEFICVGGMPEVVKTYIETLNMYDVHKVQKRILDDYKNDIAKYGSNNIRVKAREVFESIPDQLAKDNKKFQYKVVKPGGNARGYANSLGWIIDAAIGIKVNKLKTLDLPIRSYRDLNAFKFYLNDTGLLLAFYDEGTTIQILNGNLGIFKGAIYENVIAQLLDNNNLDIYYYQKSETLEVDFITTIDGKIVPIEVKSGKNTKTKSLKTIIENDNISYGILLSMNNINNSNLKIKYLPLYMIMFIK